MTRFGTTGRFRAAFFGTLTLAISLAALPAHGQALPAPTGPATAPAGSPAPGAAPQPSLSPPAGLPASPFAGPDITASPSVRPMVPPSPGSTPTPPPPSPSPNGSPTPKPDKIRTRSDEAINQRHEATTTLRGNVHVDYGDVKIDSEELNVNQNTHEIYTDTRFTLNQPDPKTPGGRQIVSGTGLRYNYDTDESTVYDANVSTPAEYPGQQIYIRAKKVEGKGQSQFTASDAVFSTCSEMLEEKVPHYHVECRALQYYAGDRIVAWDDKVYINGRYTFWLPVWVIPLKREGNSLDVGRNDIEGFYLRSFYNYALPPLDNGYFLNQGHLITNLFEKKGIGLGFENTTNWGYAATTYSYFYGLATPDRGSFLYPNDDDPQDVQDAQVKRGEALFGLNGLPFQDHQWGVEHLQRLWGDMQVGGRIQDDNIYDPLTPNYRINRRILRASLRDTIVPLGGLNYNVGYDGTLQRGTQTRNGVGSNSDVVSNMNESQSDRVSGNASFKVLNTQVQLNSDATRQHQILVAFKNQPGVASPDPSHLELLNLDNGGTVNVNSNINATSQWPGNVNSSFRMPYRIDFRDPPAPATPAPGAPTPVPTPTATPSPWSQNIEPALSVNAQIPNVGQLQMEASKYFDLTQPVPNASPLSPQQQQAFVRSQGRWDRLPEITLTSDSFLQNLQPFSLKLGYGRFFEYSTFKIPDIQNFHGTLDRYFPGNYIDRLNPEMTLGSKAQPIGLNSTLDFSGSGYRQFFYSTKDAQYAIDEHVRLSTNWTDKIQSNLNYVNNLTPNPKDFGGGGPGTPTNSSPFNQDKLSVTKQTHLTGDFNINNSPWTTLAFRGGYDYINLQYDNFSSEATWRTTVPFTEIPMGFTVNGQFQPEKMTFQRVQELNQPGLQVGGLRFLGQPLDIRYLPKIPLYGISGTWLPVTGTFTIRSQADVFGGAFGSDKIIPGWQFDNQMAYDFNTGLWQSLVNRLYFTLGDKWQNHVELMLGGYYDTNPLDKGYKFTTFGISKDLHDFVLSFQYDRIASFYSVSLTMVAFPSKPLNFTSNSFDRTRQAGGAAAFGGSSGLPF